MKRARRMGLHPRHDLSNPTRRCGGNDQATIRQGLSTVAQAYRVTGGRNAARRRNKVAGRNQRIHPSPITPAPYGF